MMLVIYRVNVACTIYGNVVFHGEGGEEVGFMNVNLVLLHEIRSR